MIRRYAAAKGIFQQFVLNEAAAMPDLAPASLAGALEAQETVLEQLTAAASEEHRRETAAPSISREGRLAERIQRLLRGERVDPSPLEYDLSGHHLGLVAPSAAIRPLLRELSAECDGRLLAVAPHESVTWAWIGAQRPLDLDRVLKWVGCSWPETTPLGIGEVTEGASGWRRSHEQARAAAGLAQPGQAAAGLAQPGQAAAVRYRDVAIVAAAAKDPLLVASLREMYLAPLDKEDGRVPLRETLRAYFAADGNGTAASFALGVSRQTVANRLLAVEERLGHPLHKCAGALQVALSLEELGRFPDPPDSRS
jgi:hypothetical protein